MRARHKGGGGGRGRGRGGAGRGWKERLTVDAQNILDQYEGQVWMEDVEIDKVAICRMGAKKTGVVVDGVEDEEYEVDAEVTF